GLEAAMQKECRIIKALQNKLTYQQRLQYMKHYFPINYTVNVQFEEVLRASNITRLVRCPNVSELSLRCLWLSVNSQVLLKIWAVLLEKHPSWEYIQDLCLLFEQLGKVDTNVWDVVEQVLTSDAGSSQKAVYPKVLLDNCVKVMRMLYSESDLGRETVPIPLGCPPPPSIMAAFSEVSRDGWSMEWLAAPASWLSVPRGASSQKGL
uniref:Uncharacterized protein n=1 Tax=Chelonoidis abingdonii TaxID=106734 RepID=A0A8C0JF31_CHEAB